MFGRLLPANGVPLGGARPFPLIAILRSTTRKQRWLAALVAIGLIAAIVVSSLVIARSGASAAYQTMPVVRQDLSQTITASGTVNPQNTVNVGTQVSGTISQVYVDFNSHVHKGQILARLDASQLQAQLSQAEAQLAQAQAQADAASNNATGQQSAITASQATSQAQAANAQAAAAGIATAQANVAKAQSAYELAQATVNRDNSLLSQGYIAQSQADADKSNLIGAQSAVQSAQAAVAQARAQAAASANQSQASAAQSTQSYSTAASSQDSAAAAAAAVQAANAIVKQDQLNLQRSVIVSPVDGTVIARDVSVGVTVAASLSTPTLFSIAQNLNKMEVDIAVGEPDIGNVKPGDRVNFTVLAYPNQTFNGTVSQVREAPTAVNNVVTYTVITLVDNPGGKLLPGMTANATVNVKTVKNALVVPAQALSWKPASGTSTHKRTGKRPAAAGASTTAANGASPWGQLGSGVATASSSGSRGVVFIEQGGKPQPVPVTVLLLSGTQAAVAPLRGALATTDKVIVSSGSASTTSSSTTRAPGAPGSTRGGIGGGGAGGLGRIVH
jgi:HlyD family secretion protein